MLGGMDPALLVSLAGLALIDSLSVGTLLIPLLLLIAPGRIRAARLLLYLGTIAAFYLLVGVLGAVGLTSALGALGTATGSPAGRIVQLVVGGILLAASFLIPTRPGGDGSGRLERWRDRLVADGSSVAAVVAVAVGAGVLELATMLPYLGAIGLLSEAPIDPVGRVAVLAGYCGLMILPAVLLLAARFAARDTVEPILQRIAAWLRRTGGETTAWIVGIVGFLLVRSAAFELGLFDALGELLDRSR